MADYWHHVPGRLRVRTERIKGNLSAARTAERMIASEPGVQRVEANTLTGSITVHYDVASTSGHAVAAALHSRGYLRDPSIPGRVGRPADRANGDMTARVVSRVATILAEKALERTVATLIAAIL